MIVSKYKSAFEFDGNAFRLDNLEKKVLVVGGGGREHAIVSALQRSMYVSRIYWAPGNPCVSMDKLENISIRETELDALKDFALENHIDLTVVGPEIPLSLGIVDLFQKEGLRIFGPDASAARIESSKDFSKQLMAKYNIPTAAYKTFDNYESALDYVRSGSFPVVLKYDGLAAGKGVVIPENAEDAESALKDMLLNDRFGKGKVVVEEFMTGPEFSFMCFVNEKEVYPLIPSQDHKRAFEGDKGPNTGGMGAYTPLPFITEEDLDYALEKIMKPMAAAMVAEGCPFKGILYGGLMKTPDGIKVVEFNCRFGDPETEVVLPLLKSDIYEAFVSVAGNPDGTPAMAFPELKWREDVCIGYVLAAKGYPGSYEKGHIISGLEKALEDPKVSIFNMGTRLDDSGNVVTNGGRVLMLVSKSSSFEDARQAALKAIDSIVSVSPSLFYRKDIAWQVLK